MERIDENFSPQIRAQKLPRELAGDQRERVIDSLRRRTEELRKITSDSQPPPPVDIPAGNNYIFKPKVAPYPPIY